MLPHPETVCVLAELDRRQVLAVAARERRAGEAVLVAGPRLVPWGGIAWTRTALLGLMGRRAGVQPAGPEAAAAPALP